MVVRNTIHLDGSLGTSSPERWSIGFTFGPIGAATPLNQEDLDSWVARCATSLGSSSLKTWWETIGANATIDTVRAYAYGATGGALRASILPVSGITGTGTPNNPFQVARCYSLRTATPGASGRGRVYVPAMAAAVNGATGKATLVAGVAASLAAFLNNLKATSAVSGTVMYPGVHSRSLDQVIPITGVRVGDVLDTQRRRRDALVETYQTANI